MESKGPCVGHIQMDEVCEMDLHLNNVDHEVWTLVETAVYTDMLQLGNAEVYLTLSAAVRNPVWDACRWLRHKEWI